MSSQQNSEFPVEIDLGREIKDYAVPANSTDAPKQNGKVRKSYPTVYLSGIEGLRDLPKDGVALIYFHRNRIGIVDRENDSGNGIGRGNGDEAEIEIRKLCLPESSGESDGDIKSAMKDFAKGAGVETGEPETDETGDENDDDGDEE